MRGNSRRRSLALLALVLLLFGVVVFRLTQLQLLDGDRYSALGASQRIRPVALPAERGAVFDRNGDELVLSVPQHTVWVDPRLVVDAPAAARALAPLLGVPEDQLLRRLTTQGAFAYLARQVDDATAQAVTDLALPGVGLLEESKRFRPAGNLARSVLGAVDIDGNGIAGLELQYDDTLTGTAGELVLEQDPNGRTIAVGEQQLLPATPGDDLVLSIDRAMQFEVERALAAQIEQMGAKGGMAIVSDVRTGEVLAMANMSRAVGEDGSVGGVEPGANSAALTTVFEPGSASKVITMAAALEEGVVRPSDTFVVPDTLQVADGVFRDHDPHPTVEMTMTKILSESSNIGTIMLGQHLGPTRVDDYLHRFGFGRSTALQFPNESDGLMLPLGDWSGTSIATIPIGQGVAVTALQMLQAYNVIANGGVYVDPKLVLATIDESGRRHPTPPSAGHRVVSARTAEQVRDMMVEVVESGTGREAAIEGYEVAGKTGTARKPQPNGGYQDGAGNYHYVATFAGFVPADDPRLSAIVVLDEPTASIYASGTAAPVFREIASYALRRFQVPPSQ